MQLKGLGGLCESLRMSDDYVVERVEWEGSGGEVVRKIRFEVFVREQGVPPDEELDEIDPVALHVLAVDADRKPCGTARLFPDASDATLAHIGRMAVLKQARARGCGRALMLALMAEATRRGFAHVELSAQTHAIGFYARFGFVVVSSDYLDCDIPHCTMRAPLTQGVAGDEVASTDEDVSVPSG